jgi:hypothetical protein
MPMLYGEGHRAFLRLQPHILASTDDQSLLAWTGPPSRFGILAESPDHFKEDCEYIERCQIMPRIKTVPTDVSNKGLRIELICWRAKKEDMSEWHVVLECVKKSTGSRDYPGIILRAVEGTEDRFERIEQDVAYTWKPGFFSKKREFHRRTYEQAIFGKCIT